MKYSDISDYKTFKQFCECIKDNIDKYQERGKHNENVEKITKIRNQMSNISRSKSKVRTLDLIRYPIESCILMK